jgi:guanosine-3',5'-bis(diphosphate) 3'-pyrophosphohydrolase
VSDPTPDFDLLRRAVAFAARAHRNHFRKDGATPYVSHVFRVCLTVRQLFDVADPRVLAAAVLHDTIEDTTTDHDDLNEHFGAEVAAWVSLLSKDKRLEDSTREAAYRATLAAAPWQVQVCKLADVHDNLSDSLGTPQQARALIRAREYLAGLKTGLKPEARGPFEIVARLLEQLAAGKPGA